MFIDEVVFKEMSPKNATEADELISFFAKGFFKRTKNFYAHLVLFFENYYVSVVFSEHEVEEEPEKYFGLFSSEKEALLFKGSLYLYPSYSSKSCVGFGLSCLNFDVCMTGEWNSKTKAINHDEIDAFQTGLVCEPTEITTWIQYNKGKQYSLDLCKNLCRYLGFDPSIRKPMLMAGYLEGYGYVQAFSLTKEEVESFYGVSIVTDIYQFFIMPTGQIIHGTYLFPPKGINSDEYLDHCFEQMDETSYDGVQIMAKGFMGNEKYPFVYSSDTSVIDTIMKLRRANVDDENNAIGAMGLFNIMNQIKMIEECSEEISSPYGRRPSFFEI